MCWQASWVTLLPVAAGIAVAMPIRAAGDDQRPVAAWVNDQPVWASQVDRELKLALPSASSAQTDHPLVRAQALRQLIDRTTILNWLTAADKAARPEEIEREVQQLRQHLAARETSLTQHLAESGQTEPELRQEFAWRISWRRYLDQYLTDENLQNWFARRRREFDGTRLQVAHILWKCRTHAEYAAATEQAAQVRRRIVAGELSFAEAARQYSQAPTAPTGGELGEIGRHEPMPAAFAQAAFALEIEQISEPVATTFGVHLIHCRGVQAGVKTWQDAMPELRLAVAVHLFEWAAEQARPAARVRFADGVPHFAPGTRQLVE